MAVSAAMTGGPHYPRFSATGNVQGNTAVKMEAEEDWSAF
jgi:hypothetical protein